jgi:hypothetical protein
MIYHFTDGLVIEQRMNYRKRILNIYACLAFDMGGKRTGAPSSIGERICANLNNIPQKRQNAFILEDNLELKTTFLAKELNFDQNLNLLQKDII